MRRLIAIAIGALLASAVPTSAAAQPGTDPAQPPPTTPAAAPPRSPEPPPVRDGSAAQTAYNRAFTAMLRGDLDTAITGFRAAASQSPDPRTRAAAKELLRLALQMKQRGIRVNAPALTISPRDSRRAEEDRVAGRTTLIISSTMASVWAGAVLIDLLNVGDDFRPSVALITGTTAAGVLASYYGSKGRTITEGMADSYTLGLTLGLGNGLLLTSPLGFTDSSAEVQTFAFASLVAGGTAGLLLGDSVRPTRGQVSFVNTTSILGVASTFLGLAIVQPNDLDPDTWLLLTAGGLDVGAGAGMAMAKDLDWSLARARLVGLGAFLGAFAGWATGALLTGASFDGDNDGRMWASTTLIGMWGGVGLTWHLTRNMRPDWRQSDKAARQPTIVTPTVIGTTPGMAVAGSF